VDFAYRLAQALNVTVEYLVTGEDKRQSAAASYKLQRAEEQLVTDVKQAVHRALEKLR
jgi:hypothetical protein